MREFRAQSGGWQIRVFYAFDPRISAILRAFIDAVGGKLNIVAQVPRGSADHELP